MFSPALLQKNQIKPLIIVQKSFSNTAIPFIFITSIAPVFKKARVHLEQKVHERKVLFLEKNGSYIDYKQLF